MKSPFASWATRLVLVVVVVGGTLWFGGSIIRIVIGNEAFVPFTAPLVFRPEQSEAARLSIIRMYVTASGWTGWAFGCAGLAALVAMWRLRPAFRQRGWLLMCSLLILLVLPMQGWLLFQDYSLAQYFDGVTGLPSAKDVEIAHAFRNRVGGLAENVVTGITMLSSLTVIILACLRPLERHES